MRQDVANPSSAASERIDRERPVADRDQAPAGRSPWAQFVKWSGLVAIVYPILFVLLFAIAGLVRPGYSPISQAVSDLGVEPMAWLLNIPVVILGLVMIALAVGFFQATRSILSSAARWTCTILIVLPGLGYITAGFFTEAPSTLLVHWLVGATLGLYLPVVTFLITGLALLSNREWRQSGVFSLAAGAVTAAAIVFMQQAFTPGSPLSDFHIAGLAERVDIVLILAWYVVFGWRLFRDASVGFETKSQDNQGPR